MDPTRERYLRRPLRDPSNRGSEPSRGLGAWFLALSEPVYVESQFYLRPVYRIYVRLETCWYSKDIIPGLFFQEDNKFAYYLSMEFLQGRALLNAVENLEIDEEVRAALAKVCRSAVAPPESCFCTVGSC